MWNILENSERKVWWRSESNTENRNLNHLSHHLCMYKGLDSSLTCLKTICAEWISRFVWLFYGVCAREREAALSLINYELRKTIWEARWPSKQMDMDMDETAWLHSTGQWLTWVPHTQYSWRPHRQTLEPKQRVPSQNFRVLIHQCLILSLSSNIPQKLEPEKV